MRSADFDRRLLLAWQRGEGREELWAELWRMFYNFAYRYCLRFCRDHFTAREMALDAFTKMSEEIERLMEEGRLEFGEGESFTTEVRRRLISRCLDQIRLFGARTRRNVSLDAPVADSDDDAIAFLHLLGAQDLSPEERLLAEEVRRRKTRNIRSTVRLVAAASEACRDESALKKWFEGIEEYLRLCLARTLTLDDLLKAADLEELDVDLTEMNKFLMWRTESTRSALDTALKRIRAKLNKEREKEDATLRKND